MSVGDLKVEAVVVSEDLEGQRDGDLVETTRSKVPDSISTMFGSASLNVGSVDPLWTPCTECKASVKAFSKKIF